LGKLGENLEEETALALGILDDDHPNGDAFPQLEMSWPREGAMASLGVYRG
jgi:hypothetical protein